MYVLNKVNIENFDYECVSAPRKLQKINSKYFDIM